MPTINHDVYGGAVHVEIPTDPADLDAHDPRYKRIPLRTLHAIREYVLEGVPGGGFLSAVLSNDLRRACHHADAGNLAALPIIVLFLDNRVPAACWGSPAKVHAWIDGFNHDGV